MQEPVPYYFISSTSQIEVGEVRVYPSTRKPNEKDNFTDEYGYLPSRSRQQTEDWTTCMEDRKEGSMLVVLTRYLSLSQ